MHKKNEGAPKSSLTAGCLKCVSLPGEPEPQLHRPAATVEDELVQELRRGYENIARVQGVGVGVLVDRPVVGRQTDAVVLVVECVESLEAELHRSALGKLHRLEQRHVPD